jgi:hypothetical protein
MRHGRKASAKAKQLARKVGVIEAEIEALLRYANSRHSEPPV